MYHSNRQPGRALENGTPFICRLTPFVGRKNSVIPPLIGKNIPIVGITSSGFTLVELIITLTIVGILATIAAPGMNNIIKDHRLTTQANDLLADLTLARSEAVRRGTWVTVCKTSDPSAASPVCNTTASAQWTAGRIIFVDSGSGTTANDGNGVLNTNETVLRLREVLEGGNKLHGDNAYTGTTTGTASNITFLATGMTKLEPKVVAYPPGEFENQMVLCDSRGPSQARRIDIHISGRARVAKTNLNLNGSTLSCP
jgi:type IV fimbrial biogenesis protein FimT